MVPFRWGYLLIMDRAYEGDETLKLAGSWAIYRWCHPTPIALFRGFMTAFCIAAAMKSNASFADSRLTGGSSRALTNWTFSFSVSLSLSSFLKLYAIVLTCPESVSISRFMILSLAGHTDDFMHCSVRLSEYLTRCSQQPINITTG